MKSDEISFNFVVCELFQSSSVRSVSVFSQSESCADASSSPVRHKHTHPLPDENSMIFPQSALVLVNGNAIFENFSRFRKIWKCCDCVCEYVCTVSSLLRWCSLNWWCYCISWFFFSSFNHFSVITGFLFFVLENLEEVFIFFVNTAREKFLRYSVHL